LRRFDDGRCGLVRGALPRIDVYDRGAIFAESKIEDLAERSWVSADRGMNSVGMRWREIMVVFIGFGGDENGDNRNGVAGFVEIFQVEAVVPGLIEV